MAKAQINLQDTFLNLARKENTEVTIYLVNGAQVRGRVKGFDAYTILLEGGGKMQMVYKHAVSTVVPQKRLPNIYGEAARTRETTEEEVEPEESEEE
jgi:host factor-I protein